MDSEKTGGSDTLLQEAEALIWALLDNELETTDVRRLEGLIQEEEQVRQLYVNCVQMHTDLQEHFGSAPAPAAESKLPPSPVLGSLGDLRPGTDSLPPVAE